MPWLSMALSGPLWAIMISHMANNYLNYTLITSLPSFMKESLNFDVKEVRTDEHSSVTQSILLMLLIIIEQLYWHNRQKYSTGGRYGCLKVMRGILLSEVVVVLSYATLLRLMC